MTYPLNPRAGIGNVVYAAGLIQSWSEGGYDFTVTRDSHGKPLAVMGVAGDHRIAAQFMYTSDGYFQASKGDPISSAMMYQLGVEAIQGRLVSSETNQVTGEISFSSGSDLLSYSEAVSLRTTAAVIGDSRHAYGWNTGSAPLGTLQAGWFNCLNSVLEKRIRVVGRFAVGGKRLDEVYAEQLPQVAALSPLPKWLILDGGYNDFNQGATYDTVVTRHASILSWAFSRGISVFDVTTGPGSSLSATGLVDLERFNAYKMALPQLGGRYRCLDLASIVTHPSARTLYTGMAFADNIHYSGAGNWAIAKGLKVQAQSIFPPVQLRKPAVFPIQQLAKNPLGYGANAGGANGFILGTGNSGTGPDYWEGGRSGTAAFAFSQVTKDTRSQPMLRCTFTAGGSVDDNAFVGPYRCAIVNWTSGGNPGLYNRVRPTVANGVQYLCVTAGAMATGADPTAGWSTELGTVFTSGSATLRVVPKIDIGDQIRGICRLDNVAFTGNGAARLSIAFLDSGFGALGTYYGDYADAASSFGFAPPAGPLVLESYPVTIPANTMYILPRLQVLGDAGTTAVIDIDWIDLQPA